VDFFGLKIGSEWGTKYMMDRLPKNVQDWWKGRGVSHKMEWLEGEELKKLVKICT
jgi:hypothetical protein